MSSGQSTRSRGKVGKKEVKVQQPDTCIREAMNSDPPSDNPCSSSSVKPHFLASIKSESSRKRKRIPSPDKELEIFELNQQAPRRARNTPENARKIYKEASLPTSSPDTRRSVSEESFVAGSKMINSVATSPGRLCSELAEDVDVRKTGTFSREQLINEYNQRNNTKLLPVDFFDHVVQDLEKKQMTKQYESDKIVSVLFREEITEQARDGTALCSADGRAEKIIYDNNTSHDKDFIKFLIGIARKQDKPMAHEELAKLYRAEERKNVSDQFFVYHFVHLEKFINDDRSTAKIRTLFLTQTVISKEFQKKITSLGRKNEVEFDKEGKIVRFISKNGVTRLKRNTGEPEVPMEELADSDPHFDLLEHQKKLIHFLRKEFKSKTTPMPHEEIAEKYNLENRSNLPLEFFIEQFDSIEDTLQAASLGRRLNEIEILRFIFMLQVPISAKGREWIHKLARNDEFSIDENGKIEKFVSQFGREKWHRAVEVPMTQLEMIQFALKSKKKIRKQIHLPSREAVINTDFFKDEVIATLKIISKRAKTSKTPSEDIDIPVSSIFSLLRLTCEKMKIPMSDEVWKLHEAEKEKKLPLETVELIVVKLVHAFIL